MPLTYIDQDSSYPAGTTIIRLRRKTVTDPYSGKEIPGDWNTPHAITIAGFIDVATDVQVAADRSTITRSSEKSLYLDDPTIDVRPGDRIKQGARTWTVREAADTPVNPFTGWQPYAEYPLESVAVGE